MNYLVPLDASAGELEKILSGIKTMLVIDLDQSQSAGQSLRPGDSLYFLRDKDECVLRVKASVVRVYPVLNGQAEDLSQTLKEMQPRVQLTEDQYNYWSGKKHVLLVEFDCAQKIGVIHIAPLQTSDRSGWIPFEEFGQVAEEEISFEPISPQKES
jgi:hypothetical protein